MGAQCDAEPAPVFSIRIVISRDKPGDSVREFLGKRSLLLRRRKADWGLETGHRTFI